MQALKGFIALTRPINLLIIAFTMYAMRWGVMRALLNRFGIQGFELEEWKFALMILVMLLLAAAGNMINDYFDLKVDRVNKPDRVIVGRTVKRRIVMVGHHAFNITATLIALYLAMDQNRWWLVLFPVIMAATLWFYSLLFKKQVWVGNFIVSILVAIVPIWTGIIEVPEIAHQFTLTGGNGAELSLELWRWLIGYAGFAFWTTLIREAQKDIEDIAGDQEGGFKTLPIVWGEKGARNYVFGLFIILFLSIGLTIYVLSQDLEPSERLPFVIMVLLAIITPAMISLTIMRRARKKADYHAASKWSKITMGGGIVLGMLMPLWF